MCVCVCWGGKRFSAGIEGQDWEERIKLVLKDSVDHVDLVGKNRNSLESFDFLEARAIISICIHPGVTFIPVCSSTSSF